MESVGAGVPVWSLLELVYMCGVCWSWCTCVESVGAGVPLWSLLELVYLCRICWSWCTCVESVGVGVPVVTVELAGHGHTRSSVPFRQNSRLSVRR